MLNKNCLICFLFTFLTINVNSSYAQDESSAPILGGTATCSVSGRSPLKKFVADGNRVLILQAEGISKGSIQLQNFFENESGVIDVNIIALFGEVPDLDLFLAGRIHSFNRNDSTLVLKKTLSKTNTTIELTNQIAEDENVSIEGKLKVKSIGNSLVNGSLNLIMNNSHLKKTVGENETELNINNGKIVVRCKLNQIPIEIKELVF